MPYPQVPAGIGVKGSGRLSYFHASDAIMRSFPHSWERDSLMGVVMMGHGQCSIRHMMHNVFLYIHHNLQGAELYNAKNNKVEEGFPDLADCQRKYWQYRKSANPNDPNQAL